MIMTSDELAQGLRDIDHLISALSAPGLAEVADPDDLNWLMARRRSMLDLLAIRRAQRGKKIVSLAMWRDGCAAEVERNSGIADAPLAPTISARGAQ